MTDCGCLNRIVRFQKHVPQSLPKDLCWVGPPGRTLAFADNRVSPQQLPGGIGEGPLGLHGYDGFRLLTDNYGVTADIILI